MLGDRVDGSTWFVSAFGAFALAFAINRALGNLGPDGTVSLVADPNPDRDNHLGSLQSLFLQTLNRVEQLPDMTRLIRLRRLHLETMKGLTSLTRWLPGYRPRGKRSRAW